MKSTKNAGVTAAEAGLEAQKQELRVTPAVQLGIDKRDKPLDIKLAFGGRFNFDTSKIEFEKKGDLIIIQIRVDPSSIVSQQVAGTVKIPTPPPPPPHEMPFQLKIDQQSLRIELRIV